MKRPDSFLTNTTAPAGRALGAAKNNPGDNTGTGADKEVYNDPAYSALAVIESYKEGGNSDTDETTTDSDMRDALEEMTEKSVDTIAEWVVGTLYSTLGVIVSWKGYQFVNYNNTGNTGKDPLTNPTYWFKIPKSDILMDQYFSGEPISGGLNTIADRAHANYRQNTLFGKYRLGGNGDDFYNFYRVALDGTVVTGDATLVAIFDVDGAAEYFNIDLIAPDVAGTRTLLDMGDYVSTPQSSSGDADTLGALVEDQFQGHWHNFSDSRVTNFASAAVTTAYGNTADSQIAVLDPIADGTNGTPRTGTTTHGKRFTSGASYVVVMIAA